MFVIYFNVLEFHMICTGISIIHQNFIVFQRVNFFSKWNKELQIWSFNFSWGQTFASFNNPPIKKDDVVQTNILAIFFVEKFTCQWTDPPLHKFAQLRQPREPKFGYQRQSNGNEIQREPQTLIPVSPWIDKLWMHIGQPG